MWHFHWDLGYDLALGLVLLLLLLIGAGFAGAAGESLDLVPHSFTIAGILLLDIRFGQPQTVTRSAVEAELFGKARPRAWRAF